jgi:type II restriction/modification system DNA methylase subunit YeeA
VRRDFPDIYEHLASFGPTFKKRGAQGEHWTNLRACAFFDDFKEEKIVWIELSDRGRFAIARDELYLLNSAYFLLPPDQLKISYLLGILNSSLITFYLRLVAETSGMGTSRWINNYVKNFPIPTNSIELQSEIIDLVDIILARKQADSTVDTSKLEAEIDRLVYKLYGLTEDQIAIVETAPK